MRWLFKRMDRKKFVKITEKGRMWMKSGEVSRESPVWQMQILSLISDRDDITVAYLYDNPSLFKAAGFVPDEKRMTENIDYLIDNGYAVLTKDYPRYIPKQDMTKQHYK